MTNLEKVIKGLECCRETGWTSCHGCPYYCGDACTCILKLKSDALTILKAQEPRLMTLDEVRNACHSPMWFESHGTFRGQKGFWCLHLGVSPSLHIKLMPAIGEQSTVLSLTAYGIVWRCWTSRPDEERRQNTPWKS